MFGLVFMSRAFNKVILIGNVGTEPSLKKTKFGVPNTVFRLATSTNYRTREGKVAERTDWFTIVAWRGLAEILPKIIKKGSRVFVEGTLRSRDILDKSGNRRQVVEIVAENILTLDQKKDKADDIDISEYLEKHQDFDEFELDETGDL